MEKFCTPAGPCATTPRAITKAAFVVLAARWPEAVAFPDLVASAHSRLNPLAAKPPREDEIDLLAGELLQCYAAGVVELHACASPFSIDPGMRPRVNPLTRYQAERGARVTTLRHDSIVVPDAIRALLPLLDGSRTLDETSAAVKAASLDASTKFADAASLKSALNQIARNALIPK